MWIIIIAMVILGMTQKKKDDKIEFTPVFENKTNESKISYSGGGGGNSPTPVEDLSQPSDNPPLPLYSPPAMDGMSQESTSMELINFDVDAFYINSTHANITLYWEIYNGVGCCATYGCDYKAYESACLNPLRLYDLRLDGEVVDDTGIDFDYECENVTPWHSRSIDYVTKGLHEIKIDTKDCINTILETTKVITV